MTETPPTTTQWPTTYSPAGLVCSVDHLASSAGVQVLAEGGSAADAAIAASAVLAVTSPHMCGMGGDLFALVHHRTGPPDVLNASGRAGSGADPERLRAEGHAHMPFKGDVRSAPVPGCVDGWVALHERHGRVPLATVLAPAQRLALGGFPASPMLAFTLPRLEGVTGCEELTDIRPGIGDRVLRPGVARMLAAVAEGGREAFYGGEFGAALLEAGAGEYEPDDLVRPNADWVDPLGVEVWGHHLWTVPPNSQGYLSLAAARIAELASGGSLPDAGDDAWAHLLVESARLAGHDREAVLHEAAVGAELLDDARLREAAERFDPAGLSGAVAPTRGGGTIYLCAVDAEGMGVSLIQSNADGFGSHVAAAGTGILLHNRGIGFSLEAGHPAEYGPGRRPPHTLAPAVATRPDGSLRAVFGTMGGDSQPQVVLQLAARLLGGGEEAGEAVAAPRFVLAAGEHGFSTWRGDEQRVRIEAHAPASWASGLTERGHQVEVADFDPAGFGHAHAIEVRPDGVRAGAADPRSMTGGAVASA
ncbi:MAG TPA: gamma-glutamyltransferase, partial [Aquihabitans sp.]|jgi:gamma-glutamyltranspeptidase/glutathione hydrolase|nr:gamma-glutamyltransferase [Aquihabitans sp.]